MDKNYFIGLDVGTESIGWAVTDEEYNLIKSQGRDYWGAYLFDEAKTAESRRMARTARRRTARTRHRLLLLQELFAEEIAKVDPAFFIRLNNSKYWLDDKDEQVKTPNVLFDDAGFTDKEYYKKYPTIFHLRKALIGNEDIALWKDPRYLYLAVHHIIKNRGHFLFEGQEFSTTDTSKVEEEFKRLNEILSDLSQPNDEIGVQAQEVLRFPLQKVKELFAILSDDNKTKKDKQNTVKEILGKSKQAAAIASAFSGGKFSVKEFFNLEEYAGELPKMEFSDSGFEANYAIAQSEFDENQIALLDSCKRIYDLCVLQNILHGEEFLSVSKVQSYQAHGEDLALLKEFLKENDRMVPLKNKKDEKANKGVKAVKENKKHLKNYILNDCKNGLPNYAAYVGQDNSKKKKRFAKCTKDDFYKFLRKELNLEEMAKTDEKAKIILEKIETGTFLPKQISGDNSVIPYQVHLAELKVMLKNAAFHYPFLRQEEDGCTVAEKIRKLMTFRIPYFVGPLFDPTCADSKSKHFSSNAWMVKKDGVDKHTKITPWNFEKVVDLDASENGFIQRMTNKCTYLRGEDVLPESSFLYSEYKFRNELNNLRVNGEKNKQVNDLVFEYAKSNKKVTLKGIAKYLQGKSLLPKEADPQTVFSGTDGDFKNSLSSYIDFKRIVGDLADTNVEMCEDIILRITLTADKNRLTKYLNERYSHLLTAEQIKQIKGLNYAKWGRLSKAFLSGLGGADADGIRYTVIDCLRNTTDNLMEVLAKNKYHFRKEIEDWNANMSMDTALSYNTVEELACSPSVKRAIWRTLQLVKEIEQVMGCPPKRIFIEMTREGEDNGKKGKRTVSRKQKLIELYKNIGKEGEGWIKEIESQADTKFNSDKLYFYYTQMGRDVYTGKKISLDDVFNTALFDIDHIYPRSQYEDDSLTNRVLADKYFNEHVKKEIYPLPPETQKQMRPIWQMWKDKGLITEEKFHRLTRTTPLTVDECAEFINRQLVETAQSTKAIAAILRNVFTRSQVVYCKASNADKFKQYLKFTKVRELNDLHHAKDAYFNIVVGNVWHTKFNGDPKKWYIEKLKKKNKEPIADKQKEEKESYDLVNLFLHDVKGAWRKDGDDGRVRDIASRNSCRIVRFTSEGKGQLFNATIKEKGANDSLIPLKENGPLSNTDRYGGYDSATTAYFMLVKGEEKKGKKVKTVLKLEPISILRNKSFRSKEDIVEYLKDIGYINPIICVEKIKINTLFSLNGSHAYIRGKTGNRIIWCNATELFLTEQDTRYLKKISNYFKAVAKYRNTDLQPKEEEISSEQNSHLYDVLTEKLDSPLYAGLAIAGQVKTLSEGQNIFIGLSLKEQCQVLWQVLALMQCNSVTSDLSKIGGASQAGKILSSQDISALNAKIILQSPTGRYRKVIECNQFLI